MLPNHVDIAIIGGGPVGALTALRLQQSGHQTLLIDANLAPRPDPRILALSWCSVLALTQAGIWQPNLAATAIEAVHISQENSIGHTRLLASELNIPVLGQVVPSGVLNQAIYHTLAQHAIPCALGTQVESVKTLTRYAHLTLNTPQGLHDMTARLVIMADGGTALPGVTRRIKDYQQSAITSTVEIDESHHHIAYERFAHDGPIALLPHQRGFALVWTQTPVQAKHYLQLNDTDFLAAIQSRFHHRAPPFTHVGVRQAFPLYLKTITKQTLPRIVFIGNAAQTLHPVAGQGLNLGIRDAITLSRLLQNIPSQQLGEADMLNQYQQLRQQDSSFMLGFTDLLIEIFDKDWPLMKALRSSGLFILDQHPFLRKTLSQRMVFGF